MRRIMPEAPARHAFVDGTLPRAGRNDIARWDRTAPALEAVRDAIGQIVPGADGSFFTTPDFVSHGGILGLCAAAKFLDIRKIISHRENYNATR